MKNAKLIDAGIDYLRVTSQAPSRQEQMFYYYQRIAMRDEKLGYEQKTGGAFGFIGKKVRHALWGVKGDWAMVQASGYEAKGGLELAKYETQCTRIDIQATYRLDGMDVGEELDRMYEAACKQPHTNCRPPTVKKIESRHKVETVYIGSRASDIYIRLYDKYEESGKEEYKSCLRFEVEIKGRAAKALWRKMVEEQASVGYLLSLLFTLCAERGVLMYSDDFPQYGTTLEMKQVSSEENKIAWLARQVAPTVSKLTSTHGWILLFSVLFDRACNDFDKHAIISSLARSWGN